LNRIDDYKKIADSYFDFLTENFPVMCASDEFDFFPRVANADRHYDKLGSFDSKDIEKFIARLNEFHKRFAAAHDETADLDGFIDVQLLRANAAGILIELDTKRSWRFNPLLYLKICFIGLDHALNKPAPESREVRERSLARLSGIPDILKNGMDNIQSVPEA